MIKERLSGHYLAYNGKLIKRGIVLLDENRCVVDVIDHGGKPVELPVMRYLNGILIPVNDNSQEHINRIRLLLSRMLEKGERSMSTLIKKGTSEFICKIQINETISFILIKNLDYKKLEICNPVTITPVKWLY